MKKMKWYGLSLPKCPQKLNKLKRFLAPVSLPIQKPTAPISPFLTSIASPFSKFTIFVISFPLPVFVLHFVSKLYKIIFPISMLSTVTIDNSSRAILVSALYRWNGLNTFVKTVTNLVLASNSFFTLKMKFKGKGYNIFRNVRNSILFKFGYSHRVYGFFNNVSLLNFTKTSLILLTHDQSLLKFRGHNFFQVKPINLYTGRGIRFASQIIYRKLGKVGSYR